MRRLLSAPGTAGTRFHSASAHWCHVAATCFSPVARSLRRPRAFSLPVCPHLACTTLVKHVFSRALSLVVNTSAEITSGYTFPHSAECNSVHTSD